MPQEQVHIVRDVGSQGGIKGAFYNEEKALRMASGNPTLIIQTRVVEICLNDTITAYFIDPNGKAVTII